MSLLHRLGLDALRGMIRDDEGSWFRINHPDILEALHARYCLDAPDERMMIRDAAQRAALTNKFQSLSEVRGGATFVLHTALIVLLINLISP